MESKLPLSSRDAYERALTAAYRMAPDGSAAKVSLERILRNLVNEDRMAELERAFRSLTPLDPEGVRFQ